MSTRDVHPVDLGPSGPRLDVQDPAANVPGSVDGPTRTDETADARARRALARLWLGALALALAALAVVEATSALTAPLRVATDADWEAAAAEVRAGYKPGDLIVFAPAWSDPVGRLHLGDLVTPEMAARPDADRYARIWEVSIRGARAPETLSDDAFAQLQHKHGRVRVALYERHRVSPPLFDFTAHLGEARVVQTPGGEPWENPCVADGAAAFRCTSVRVERRILEIDYQPRLGILAPVDGKLQTYLEWQGVPIGNSLVVHAGLHDYYARKNGDGRVQLKIYVNGTEVLARTVGNSDGWLRFDVDTARFKGKGTVRFEYSAAQAAWRNLGLHAETREASVLP